MSANPTRVEWEANEMASPLEQGNRVLESIARQEAMRALLAFSDLHEQIQERHVQGYGADRDLFETERFILDEVLQLITDRAQALTPADGIVIALADTSQNEDPQMVCRASSGALAVERGVRLFGDSEFLRECLQTGNILRCDDCAIDARAELDFARAIGARSSVLVPLSGRNARLGVMQAFSNSAWAFSDHDIRCLDLFSELVLSALKPADQDRRIHWLSGVAEAVLHAKAEAAAGAVGAPVIAEVLPQLDAPQPAPVAELEAAAIHDESIPAGAPALEASALDNPETVAELPELESSDEACHDPIEIQAEYEPATVTERRGLFGFLRDYSFSFAARPGLSVVMVLVAVAALFSAGAWWGMQMHGKTSAANAELAAVAGGAAPKAATAPEAPSQELSLEISDNLMTTAGAGQNAPQPVPQNKLAALPKITGLRHWASSVGSTVVIDMDDQVPYEVHRLMSPERIYFDLHDTALAADLSGKTMDVGDASLKRVRVAQPVAGVTRIVLDTKDGSNFSVSMESNPYRLVVELRGGDRAVAMNPPAPRAVAPPVPQAAKPAPALESASAGPPVPARTGKFRIVLDAGHGGWDLGTVGRQGLLEKDLVLDVTQRLGKLLQSRLGVDVLLTRSGDSYLPLDQRADFANQSQADLFVSVHANYSSSETARGVETYYTNVFSAPGSKESDKHEDGGTQKLMPVSLPPGGLHEKVEQSRRLAANVQRSLYATLAAHNPDIRNRGIKDASYVVLTGTTMPAILTEISFVSSPADERNLQSAVYRQQIAEALYKGISAYEQTAPKAKVAQLQTAASRR